MKILGINYLSESSISYMDNGNIKFSISEERLNRIKNWYGNPWLSINHFLKEYNLKINDIDLFATHGLITKFSNKRFNSIEYNKKIDLLKKSQISIKKKKYLISQIKFRKKKEQLAIERAKRLIRALKKNIKKKIHIFDHHTCHAATAAYFSGWKKSYVLTIDGWGDGCSSKLFSFKKGKLSLIRSTSLLDSLGYFYGSITKLLGFTPHRHEGKVLGLAAYGNPNLAYKEISEMISFDKKSKNFVSHPENGLYLPLFENNNLRILLKKYKKKDIAAATQKHLENIVTDYVKSIDDKPFNLTLSGGVFSNVKLNQKLSELNNIKDIFVFPNMGDGGLSVGAAVLCHLQYKKINSKRLKNYYLGLSFSNDDIKLVLNQFKLNYVTGKSLEKKVAKYLHQNKTVAVFQGKMEFGPRSLGNRSILASSKDFKVNKWLNKRLGRTEFMPFAPITLKNHAKKMYENFKKGIYSSKFMTVTYNCSHIMKKISPAPVHIDGTARPQIIDKSINPRVFKILNEYYKISKNPNLINTSFNMHEEPIVYTPNDAVKSFLRSKLDYLYIGDYLIKKRK